VQPRASDPSTWYYAAVYVDTKSSGLDTGACTGSAFRCTHNGMFPFLCMAVTTTGHAYGVAASDGTDIPFKAA
jgi:hypothetical protein